MDSCIKGGNPITARLFPSRRTGNETSQPSSTGQPTAQGRAPRLEGLPTVVGSSVAQVEFTRGRDRFKQRQVSALLPGDPGFRIDVHPNERRSRDTACVTALHPGAQDDYVTGLLLAALLKHYNLVPQKSVWLEPKDFARLPHGVSFPDSAEDGSRGTSASGSRGHMMDALRKRLAGWLDQGVISQQAWLRVPEPVRKFLLAGRQAQAPAPAVDSIDLWQTPAGRSIEVAMNALGKEVNEFKLVCTGAIRGDSGTLENIYALFAKLEVHEARSLRKLLREWLQGNRRTNVNLSRYAERANVRRLKG